MNLQELKEQTKNTTTFDEAIHLIADYIADLVISKQRDYGTKNILNSPFGAEKGILVRLWDKFARLANLLKNGKVPKNESIMDTWTDVIGYSFIAIMVRFKVFELPLKEE